MRKFKMCYNPTTQQKVKVYSLAEELQFFASLGYTLDAEFISKADKEWQTDLTDEQKYRINQVKEVEEMSDFIKENEGKYIHNMYEYISPYMKELEGNNLDIIRMIMLATNLTFGNKLFDNNKNEIKKPNLKTIWGTTSRNSINKTYNKLLEVGYITETEEGYIKINEDIFYKGAIENWKQVKKINDNLTYTRIFSENIQEIFYGTKDRERKRLANFFKILPFVNFKYNVLCNNPTEVDDKKLELLNWKELVLLCGVDETNSTKLKNDLMKLRIQGYEVIGQFETGSGKAICVNPKVYYGGNDANEVRHLYSMFRMCDKNLNQ